MTPTAPEVAEAMGLCMDTERRVLACESVKANPESTSERNLAAATPFLVREPEEIFGKTRQFISLPT